MPHLLTDKKKNRQRVNVAKNCFKCFQLMTKSSLLMSTQVMKLGSNFLSPSDRLAIQYGSLKASAKHRIHRLKLYISSHGEYSDGMKGALLG